MRPALFPCRHVRSGPPALRALQSIETMAIRTELSLRLPNSPGALADVCGVLAEERVRVQALMLESGGTLRLLVDNPVRGAGVLRARRHAVTETDVVVTSVSSAPGGLGAVLALVRSAGVNVEYAYTAAPEASGTALAILGVDDAVKAGMAAGM